jgi:hypothetical protein
MPKLRAAVLDGGNEPAEIQQERRTGHRWQPGQSGNPAGRQLGSRNKFSEDFLRDFHEAWQTLGKAALTSVAWLHPADFVRAAVALVPKEFHATVTKININRLSDAELDALIEREIRAAPDQETAAEDPTILQ